MTEPNSPQSPDDLWQAFDDNEISRAEKLEEQYRVIEGYNALLLNQVAGIEDSVFVLEGKITDDGIDTSDGPSEFRGKTQMAILFLQPDRTKELIAQGEPGEHAELYGNPYVIRGEVPERTQKLIDELFLSTEATLDEDISSPELEVWKGNVAGVPVEFDVHKQTYRIITGNEEKLEKSLAIYVNRSRADLPTQIGQTVTEALAATGMKVIDEQGSDTTDVSIDDMGDSARKSAQTALDKIGRQQARRKAFEGIRRKIFPSRREH